MDDDLRQGEQLRGRHLVVSAWGSGPDLLELAALDGARQFFGPGVRLEIVRDYTAFAYPDREAAKRYHANVTVREVA